MAVASNPNPEALSSEVIRQVLTRLASLTKAMWAVAALLFAAGAYLGNLQLRVQALELAAQSNAQSYREDHDLLIELKTGQSAMARELGELNAELKSLRSQLQERQ